MSQLLRRVRYVKRVRRFQKPGVTHQFEDRIPEAKIDGTPAIPSIAASIDVEAEQLHSVFKGFFDTLSKPTHVGTFEEEMKMFKISSQATSFHSLLGESSSTGSLKIVPDTSVMNNLLRNLASKGDAKGSLALLSRMTKDFGVKPNEKSKEIVAYALFKAGDMSEALSALSSLPSISNLGQFVIWKMIQKSVTGNNSETAWSLFNGLRAKALPAPEICSTMLMHCGKQDKVELAFKIYKELQSQGLTPHWLTFSALIYAASKRKEFYPKAVELFREMELGKMPIDIRVYNNMLYATSKVSDVHTALELWNSLQAEPEKVNEFTVANLLWTLASVETAKDKISKRTYHHDMNPEDLKAAAIEIMNNTSHITLNSFVLNAYLAVMTNHNFVEEAEKVYAEEFPKHSVRKTTDTFEIMLKLYDTQRNFEKTTQVLNEVKATGVSIGPEAWRAAIRTAALTTNLETSIDWLRQMVEQTGRKPTVEQLKALHLRLCEEEKWHLRQQMGELCLPPAKIPANPYTTWRQRSVGLAKLFEKVYGKDAPQLATKIE